MRGDGDVNRERDSSMGRGRELGEKENDDLKVMPFSPQLTLLN